jgi:hypothetical protein
MLVLVGKIIIFLLPDMFYKAFLFYHLAARR